MRVQAACVLYTQDPDLVRRAKAFARSITQIRHVEISDRLESVLHQSAPALLIVDLRARDSSELIEQIQNEWTDVLIVALGTLRSEPLREADQAGIYAAEDLELDRRRFQALLVRAMDHLRILEENRELKEERSPSIQREPMRRPLEPGPERHASSAAPLLRFARAFRRHESVNALLASVVEGVADAVGVTRVGIFSKIREPDTFQLRAGLRCLPETEELEYRDRDSLVQWFELHAHLINRADLAHTNDRNERSVLRRALDSFGAEVIAPLYARGRIIGWLFVGYRLTGQPFAYHDLEQLTLVADHVSALLENALLNEEVSVQKSLAETLLKTIPPGIVATDEEGIVRWFNPMAEEILGLPGGRVLNKPIEAVGSTLAGCIRDTLEARAGLPARHWTDQNTQRSLLVETRRLTDGEKELGAVAVIQDLTAEKNLREKQDLVERAAFWTDLAASMSHEIRNPLVAIKTFAQLLPERYEDADFRKDFSDIVVREIDRLDKIITQINNFAHPPELIFKPVDVRSSVNKAVQMARDRFGLNGEVAIETSLPNDLPKVLGDESALAEAFAHLVANAAEAVAGQDKPRISLTANPVREGNRAREIVVTISDNGKGIDPDMRDKIFSPFCTTKPRGMGLGLPIVKRTIFDHNGRVEIDSGSDGTTVNVTLPVKGNGR
jgi:PAS domain S-box-containing protein